MNIYSDESGSINNKQVKSNPYFVICLIHAVDVKKLKTVFSRFVSANIKELARLDQKHGRMFKNGTFYELKGNCFDKPMKQKFCSFFSKKPLFEMFYIVTDNARLADSFCSNTARAYNYLVCKSLYSFKKRNLLPDESCVLQLDERNERTETKHFLENYLNTELVLTGIYSNEFVVSYFDSSQNKLIQIADVFANLMYSHLITQAYSAELQTLKDNGILKFTFEFPLSS